MKKFIELVLVITMVLITMMTTAIGEYDNYLDNYFPDTSDIRDAYNKGVQIDSEMYYYRCAVYSAHATLNATGLFGHRVSIEEIEEYIEKSLRDVGALHPIATITKIGVINEEPIYRIEIGSISDLNKNLGGNVGNGFIGEGMAYNLIVCIGTIV